VATAAPTPASLIPTGEYTPSYLALEDEVIEWTESVYDQIYNDKSREKESQATAKIIEYLEGKQWSERARYSRSRPVVDKFSRHFWESVGLLTDLSLDFTVKMFDKVNDYNDLERLLNDCTVRWAMKNGFEDRLYDVVLYGLLHTGPAKIQWKSSLNGGWGDVQMVPVAPWQFGMIGADYDIDDAEVICTWQPTNIEKLVRELKAIRSTQLPLPHSAGRAIPSVLRISRRSDGRSSQARSDMPSPKSSPQWDHPTPTRLIRRSRCGRNSGSPMTQ
jgi:hypothetical protein